jgi:hypothetical protein
LWVPDVGEQDAVEVKHSSLDESLLVCAIAAGRVEATGGTRERLTQVAYLARP